MKVEQLNVYTFGTSVIVSLPEIGKLSLDNCLSEQEVADILNITLNAATRKLAPEQLLKAAQPEVLSLSHDGVEDAEFTPIPL